MKEQALEQLESLRDQTSEQLEALENEHEDLTKKFEKTRSDIERERQQVGKNEDEYIREIEKLEKKLAESIEFQEELLEHGDVGRSDTELRVLCVGNRLHLPVGDGVRGCQLQLGLTVLVGEYQGAPKPGLREEFPGPCGCDPVVFRRGLFS